MGKLSRTRRRSKVGLSRVEAPCKPQEAQAHIAPEPATALATAVASALANRDFAPALSCAKAVLLARDPEADPCAPVLVALLAALEVPANTPNWLPVHFDGRVEECFEQMLALIHQQNIQIAELWRIAADFV